MAKSANKPASDKPKRKAPHSAWKPGQSGNPAGAPKRGESWQEIIKRVGEYTPGEAAQRSLELAQQLLKIGEGVTLKEAVILRVYASLLFEPQPGLLNAFMERAEGKVNQTIEVLDWREEVKKRGLDPDKLVEEFVAHMGAGRDSDGSPATTDGESHPAPDSKAVE